MIFGLIATIFLGIFCWRSCRSWCKSDDESSQQQDQDRRFAQQLQEREVQNAIRMTPEEKAAARQAWDKKATMRSHFVDEVLPSGESSIPGKENDDTIAIPDGQLNDEDSEVWRCTICLTECGQEPDGRDPRRVKGTAGTCDHEFHRECISGWLLHRIQCPVCRQPFLKEDIHHATLVEKIGEENESVTIDHNSSYVPVVSMRSTTQFELLHRATEHHSEVNQQQDEIINVEDDVEGGAVVQQAEEEGERNSVDEHTISSDLNEH